MILGPATLTDDRGRRFVLAKSSALVDPSNAGRWISREAGDLASRLASASQLNFTLLQRVAASLGFGLLMAVVVTAIYSLERSRGIPPAISLAVMLGVIFVFARLLTRSWRERRAKVLTTIWLNRARCASCGYGLQGNRVDADGCVGCPECQAAWEAERLGAGELKPGMVVPSPPHVPDGVIIYGPRSALTAWGLGSLYGKDASVAPVPLVDPRLKAAAAAATEPGLQQRVRCAQTAMKRRPGRLAMDFVKCLLLIGFCVLQIWFISRTLGAVVVAGPVALTWDRIVGLILPALGLTFWLGVSTIVTSRFIRRGGTPRPSEIIHAMRAEDLCPSCATDLARAAFVNGRCTCPLCGAVWN